MSSGAGQVFARSRVPRNSLGHSAIPRTPDVRFAWAQNSVFKNNLERSLGLDESIEGRRLAVEKVGDYALLARAGNGNRETP